MDRGIVTTLEEARRCPRCNDPGELTKRDKNHRGFTLHTIFCRNPRCKWFNTPWTVEQRPDGTIPERVTHSKSFPKIPDRTEQVQASLDRQRRQELENGGGRLNPR